MLANCVRESMDQHLKVMHQRILETKNEDIYADWMLLLNNKPNEMTEEMDGFYLECCDLFADLIADVSH